MEYPTAQYRSGMTWFVRRASNKGFLAGGAKGGRAMDPVERIRFHVTRARATKKLDLSTWANRRKGDFLLSRVPRTVRWLQR